MSFPPSLPEELRCDWGDIAYLIPLNAIPAQWQAVVRFAEKHGVSVPLPADPPDEILSDWLTLKCRRDGSSFADQWTAVRCWANDKGYELSVAQIGSPEIPMRY